MRFNLIFSTIFTIAGMAVSNTAVAASTENQPLSKGHRIITESGELTLHVIEHATFVLQWGGKTIYVDPVGGARLFRGFPQPDIILITDIHSDHMNWETVKNVISAKTRIVSPRIPVKRQPKGKGLVNKIPKGLRGKIDYLENDRTAYYGGIAIEAIPMYNLSSDRARFHNKGRGNGYVVDFEDLRVYISGDTEDIPEMRELKDIDVAFVCMNSPYTMEVEKAASAVLEFKPQVVFPNHYRNRDGTFSDVQKFKELVAEDSGIEVRLLNWYP